MVAVLWSLNLGAVYPFIEVVIKGKSLHEWIEVEEVESAKLIADSQANIEQWETELEVAGIGALSEAEATILQNKISANRYDIEIQETRGELRDKLAPYIDKYAPDDPFTTLAYLMGFMFFGTVMRGLFLMGSMVSVARVSQRTMLDMQNRVFQNVLDMEASELGVKGTGDLVSRIRGETGAIGQAIATLFGKTVREPLKMGGCLTGAALINWRLLLFSILICPIAGFLMIKLAQVTKRANKRALEESARLLNRLYQALTYMRVVKAFTNEDSERRRFELVANDVYKRSMKISIFGALSRINNELLGVSMITLSVLAGGYLVLNTTTELWGIRMCDAPMGFGSLMLFFTFLIGIADPLRKMADVYNMVQGGVVAADRVFPLIDQVPAIRNPEHPREIPSGELGLEFDQVRFEYEPGKPILNGVTESVPAGTSLAIVGHNGCGKSTLINLIPRFFDTNGSENPGVIKIGDRDVREYRVKELRQKIGYVTQQTMLFNDSIAANIAYGKDDATPAEIETAARKAHAHEFISELENGYESTIGEHGGKLSGGQRQRLSLARAILKDPEILILDEATSQIDPESEKLIHETLAEFIQGRTTVVITHRMSTLELVDRIMVMKDGQVVDCGTHEQLIARCSDYRRMRNVYLEEVA
ncbi:MAG: subfamily B ATP-binding cassette protein MsbA [Mariniblastus sp.]|jgi:subfamily B ATP-binding cassette protein MsbA